MRTRPVLVVLGLSVLACTGGGGGSRPLDSAEPLLNDQDVRGLYAVSWSDTFTVRLDVGGAVQESTTDADGIVTFNAPDGTPLELDLAAWCADPTVNCPSEAWPANLAINEDDPAVKMDLHSLHAWDADWPAQIVDGLVDHRTDALLFGLDGGSGSSGDCGAVAVSLAGGTFVYADALGADTADTAAGTGDAPDFSGGVATAGGPVGIDDGKVALGWLGVCAWSGLAVAATLSVETEFTAVRIGDLTE